MAHVAVVHVAVAHIAVAHIAVARTEKSGAHPAQQLGLLFWINSRTVGSAGLRRRLIGYTYVCFYKISIAYSYTSACFEAGWRERVWHKGYNISIPGYIGQSGTAAQY